MRSLRSRLLPGGLIGLLAAAVALSPPLAPNRVASAAPPPAQLPPELACVPHDAALFVHAEAGAIWTGDLAKSFRETNPAPRRSRTS
jgi:hypothetical protein